MTERQRGRTGHYRRVAALAAFAVLVTACGAGTSRPASPASGSPRTQAPGSPAAEGKAGPDRAVASPAADPSAAPNPVPAWLASLEAKAANKPGHLAPGSDPAVLPGPVLIADRSNNRVLIVDPRGRVLWSTPGQGLPEPDDAFFGPDGRQIIATQEDESRISVLSVPSGRITWHYGHTGISGAAHGYLSNPDDAMLLPDGKVMTADIKNCRLLELSQKTLAPVHVYGETTTDCYHAPPQRFGSPNGMFPMANGDWLVTEINGDWVDEITPSGRIVWSANPPGITYPSDTNEVKPGVYLTVSYTYPGSIEEFTKTGRLLWSYAPQGANALNDPSLALPLPNGDILANADYSDRIVVIDPKTSKIVWQYGHTGMPGSGPGYLHKPDGVDLAPPYSLLGSHAASMGVPPYGR